MGSNDYRRILIAVEDARFMDAMIDFVSKHKWTQQSQFKVLHVREPGISVSVSVSLLVNSPEVPMAPPRNDEQRAAAQQLLDDVIGRLDAVVSRPVEGFLELGNAQEVILQHAQNWPADLILMASSGRGGWMKGSASQSVADSASCDTIVIHPGRQSAAA